MATRIAATFAVLIIEVVSLGVCPWDRERGWQSSSLTASTWDAPFSERGITCPVDPR